MLNLFQSKPNTFDVSSVKYKKPIDNQLVNKLIGYLSIIGNHKIMVGMSGEFNSLVAAKVLKQAVGENIIAMIFDFGTAWTNNLIEACKQLGLESYILKREAAYQSETAAYQLHKPSDIRNFYQRFINYHLLIQSDMMKRLIVDTIDKSDRLLGIRPEGFYGHFMPFYSLYKSELYDLASFLGIPHQFISNSAYQDLPYPDNTALPWDKMDPILFLLTEKQLTPEQISQDLKVDLQWLKKLKSHIDKQILKTTVSQFII